MGERGISVNLHNRYTHWESISDIDNTIHISTSKLRKEHSSLNAFLCYPKEFIDASASVPHLEGHESRYGKAKSKGQLEGRLILQCGHYARRLKILSESECLDNVYAVAFRDLMPL